MGRRPAVVLGITTAARMHIPDPSFLPKRRLKPAHVTVHARHGVGVERGCAYALVFANADRLRGQRQSNVRRHLADDACDGLLVYWVGIGIEETNGNRVDAQIK